MNRQAIKSTIRFSGELVRPELTGKTGAWMLLTLPKNASAKLPLRDALMVEGIINGYPFRATVEPDGKGGHRLKVGKALREAASADVADAVSVEVTRVGDETEVRAPMDLRQGLADVPRAQAMWAVITPMARRDWILWLCTAKLLETRKDRIRKACDMLAHGKRRVCCFGGLNWLTKDHAKVETWLPLPAAKKLCFAETKI